MMLTAVTMPTSQWWMKTLLTQSCCQRKLCVSGVFKLASFTRINNLTGRRTNFAVTSNKRTGVCRHLEVKRCITGFLQVYASCQLKKAHRKQSTAAASFFLQTGSRFYSSFMFWIKMFNLQLWKRMFFLLSEDNIGSQCHMTGCLIFLFWQKKRKTSLKWLKPHKSLAIDAWSGDVCMCACICLYL